ncbi:hypothetical protein [Streptomyces sp. NPDC057623]|uniref:hypothetical protein n=1 Tax=Streptomyces sp. NPDC057623 TaxID=3346187 RepID=UPI0036C83EBB
MEGDPVDGPGEGLGVFGSHPERDAVNPGGRDVGVDVRGFAAEEGDGERCVAAGFAGCLLELPEGKIVVTVTR